MRVAKVIGWSTIVLLGLVAVLVLIALSLDLSTYREPLQLGISKAVGRRVSLRGEMSLQLSLYPTIAIEDVRVANPPWASRSDLARAARVELQLALWSLVRGDLKILKVGIEGLDLLLEARADGADNWTFGQDTGRPAALPEIQALSCERCVLAVRVDADRVEQLVIAAAAGTLTREEPVQFLLSGSYRDIPFTLSLLGGTLTDLVVSSKPWPLQAKLRAAGATLEVTGDIGPTDANLKVVLSGEQLGELPPLSGVTLPALGPYGLSGRVVKQDQSYSVSELAAHLGEKENINRLVINAGSVALTANEPVELSVQGKFGDTPFTVSGTGGTPAGLIAPGQPWPIKLSATGAGAAFEIEGTIAEPLKAPTPDLRVSIRGKRLADLAPLVRTPLPKLGPYRLSGLVQQRDSGYTVTAMTGSVGRAGRRAYVVIRKGRIVLPYSKALRVNLEGSFEKTPLRASFIGGPLAGLAAPGKPWPVMLDASGAGATLAVRGTVARPNRGESFDLKVDLKGRRLSRLARLLTLTLPTVQSYAVSGRVRDRNGGYVVTQLKAQADDTDIGGSLSLKTRGPRPGVTAKLASNTFDVSKLIVPGAAATGEREEFSLDDKLPAAWLRAMDADLELEIGRVAGAPIPIRDLAMSAKLENGKAALTLTRVSLLGANFAGALTLDASGEMASLALDLSTKSVDAAKALKTRGGVERLRGETGKMDLRLASSGRTLRTLVERASLTFDAQAMELSYRSRADGTAIPIKISTARATAIPGQAVRIAADAVYREVPINLVLRGESLVRLIEDRKSWPLTLSARTDNTSLVLKSNLIWPIDTENFRLALTLKGERVDELDPLLKTRLPPYGPYVISGQLERKNKTFYFSQIDAQIGRSHAKGNLTWSTAGSRPEIKSQFEFDPLQLEKLIEGLMREYGSADEKPKRDLVFPEFSIPVDALRSVDLDLNLRATEVLGAQTQLGDVKVKLFLNDGRLAISPFEARLSGGEISLDLQLDARKEPPTVVFLLKVKHLDYGTLLKELGVTEGFEAKGADVEIKFVGNGATLHGLLGSANGKVVFVSGPANLAGADPLRLASLTSIIIKTATSSKDNTQINCMIWPFEIIGGVARSEQILIDMPRYTIGGSGTVDLATDKLKMVFRPRPKSPKFTSFAIPVEVRGSMMKPEVDRAKKRRRLALQIVVPLLWIKPGTGVQNPCVEAIAKRDSATVKKKKADSPDPFDEFGGN